MSQRHRRRWPLTALPLAAAALVAIVAVCLRRRPPVVATTVILDPDRSATMAASGAVHSVQAADLTLPAQELDRIWSPMHLERLARTYWRFLTRISLGLIRVLYRSTGRELVLLGRPLVLMRFHVPEYELSADRGRVRWRIRDGLLVSQRGRGEGHLQIDVRRAATGPDGKTTVHVEVAVASFYPAIAAGIGSWVYRVTQSRIHVLVTHGFLRSLARLDLAESRAGVYADEG